MDSILYQLFYTKTIPYISKKSINDLLCRTILPELGLEFHENIYRTVVSVMRDNAYIVKGDVAVAAHLRHDDVDGFVGQSERKGRGHQKLYEELCLTGLKINVSARMDDADDDDIVNDVSELTTESVLNLLPLEVLKIKLEQITSKYRTKLESILKKKSLSDNGLGIVYDDHHDTLKNSLIMFKSYVNEAVKFGLPIRFTLNNDLPIKMTISMVNDDDYVLVRYSFNVHAKRSYLNVSNENNNNNNNISSNKNYVYNDVKGEHDRSISLFRCNESMVSLSYFPFDLYFLDLHIDNKHRRQRQRGDIRSADDLVLCSDRIFTIKVVVDNLETVIVDQLDRLLFNIFHYQFSEIDTIVDLLRRLIHLLFRREDSSTTRNHYQHQLRAYHQIKNDYRRMFSPRDVKTTILSTVGPVLGATLIIELYFQKRFKTTVRDVTHEINFPYHYWEYKYFSKCWKRYCRILKHLFCINSVVIY
ncbi:ac18 [Hemileuca sp. nucleopolyhedrovirus]|uniref:Ac18 n=1 Tax=Hemileuca sp. nucleopolyhedrovirus TaxID=1367203 RepID=S5N9E9_9ABAC|nr:ac18 [Hemileuca sp. nucleopolyhedrovirus]AGR56877.1 ac18 [Hemileuca sp. nucleopolyhedrovirus]